MSMYLINAKSVPNFEYIRTFDQLKIKKYVIIPVTEYADTGISLFLSNIHQSWRDKWPISGYSWSQSDVGSREGGALWCVETDLPGNSEVMSYLIMPEATTILDKE